MDLKTKKSSKMLNGFSLLESKNRFEIDYEKTDAVYQLRWFDEVLKIRKRKKSRRTKFEEKF